MLSEGSTSHEHASNPRGALQSRFMARGLPAVSWCCRSPTPEQRHPWQSCHKHRCLRAAVCPAVLCRWPTLPNGCCTWRHPGLCRVTHPAPSAASSLAHACGDQAASQLDLGCSSACGRSSFPCTAQLRARPASRKGTGTYLWGPHRHAFQWENWREAGQGLSNLVQWKGRGVELGDLKVLPSPNHSVILCLVLMCGPPGMTY